MLTNRQVEAFHKRRIDLPAAGCSHLLHHLQGTEAHPVAPPHRAPPAYRLDHLRLEQPGQRPPVGLGRWTFARAVWWLHPVPIVCQQGRPILPKTISEKQRGTVGGQDLCDVVNQALRHGAHAISDVKRKQWFALRVHRHPHPLGRTLQALAGFSRADLASLDRAEQTPCG